MMDRKLTAAQVYGLIEVARLHVGPAITSMSAASVEASKGNPGTDVRDAIGRAMLLLQDSTALPLEADRMIAEMWRES